jgi:N-acetylglucosamine-6-phosphate deacetylase
MDDMEDDTRDCIRKSYEFLDEVGTKQMLTTKITKGTQRKPKATTEVTETHRGRHNHLAAG